MAVTTWGSRGWTQTLPSWAHYMLAAASSSRLQEETGLLEGSLQGLLKDFSECSFMWHEDALSGFAGVLRTRNGVTTERVSSLGL